MSSGGRDDEKTTKLETFSGVTQEYKRWRRRQKTKWGPRLLEALSGEAWELLESIVLVFGLHMAWRFLDALLSSWEDQVKSKKSWSGCFLIICTWFEVQLPKEELETLWCWKGVRFHRSTTRWEPRWSTRSTHEPTWWGWARASASTRGMGRHVWWYSWCCPCQGFGWGRGSRGTAASTSARVWGGWAGSPEVKRCMSNMIVKAVNM